MNLAIRTEHRQGQSLSPRLQHAVRLLQMSSMDFATMIRDTLGKNPFLESEDGDDDEAGLTRGDEGSCPYEREHPGLSASELRESRQALLAESAELGGVADGADIEPEYGSDDRGVDNGGGTSPAQADEINDRDLWHSDAGTSPRRGEDGEMSALDMVAADTALNTHLHGQINLLPLTPRELAVAQTIVESLDDDGYLRTPLEELLALADLTPEATLAEMEVALHRVQSLDPAGVGARGVGECLMLQLPAIECPDLRRLASTIIRDHLLALAARDVTSLAKRLAETPARVGQACDRIRRLDARPGWRFGSTRVPYVVPDVLVKKVRGQWTVQLNPAVVPKVRINEVYASLYRHHRSAQNAELGANLQEARWTLRNVEQRFSTIVQVAEAIVKRQASFLEYGAMAMKPLGLREIADEVGVHESTVSRATNNKYMATPSGVYELKYFFSRSMLSANGSACSGTAIRGLIKDIIEVEHIDAPQSDAEITRQLAAQGLVVARRTVTKYRQMLKIDAVERRRRHA